MSIEFTEDGSKFVNNVEPVVKYERYIEFKMGDKTVGRIDATFDFTDMPDEYHSTALQMVMKGAMTLALPCYKAPPVREQMEGNEPKKKKWLGLF